MDILFSKVFKNKYLCNKIFNFIKNKDDDENSLGISFKNLNTLEILSKTKNLELLKYKLESPFENVYITNTGINEFFKINETKNNDSSIVLKEILKILLEKKREQFEICNLTEEAIKCNNTLILDILINEPYKIKVYPSSLEHCVLNCHPSTLEKLLILIYGGIGRSLVSTHFKYNSLKNAQKNKKYYIEMLEFLLDNSNLYHSEPATSIHEKLSFKTFKELNLKSKYILFDLDRVHFSIYEGDSMDLDSLNKLSFEEEVFGLKQFCRFILNLDNSKSSNNTATKIKKLFSEIDVNHSIYSRNKELNNLKELKKLIRFEYLKGKPEEEEEEENQSEFEIFLENIKNSKFTDKQVKEFIEKEEDNSSTTTNQFRLTDEQFESFRLQPRIIFNRNQALYFTTNDFENMGNVENLISIIELLIIKFSKSDVKIRNVAIFNSYNTIFNFLYEKLIKFENVTKEQVLTIHKLLIENSIEVKHDFYHVFYYLSIRDSRFIKLLLSNPLSSSHIDYDCSKSFSSRGYNIGRSLLPLIEKYTINFILNGEFKFKNSFIDIIKEIITNLYTNVMFKTHYYLDSFFSKSMDALLQYCLEIGNVDLFFQNLNLIKIQIDLANSDALKFQDTDFPILTFINQEIQSKLDQNQLPIPPYLKSIPLEMYNLKYPLARFVYSYPFKNNLLNLMCTRLDLDQIKLFLEFDTNKYQQKLLFTLYDQALINNRLDIIQLLLFSNEYNQFFKMVDLNFGNHYNNQETKLIIESKQTFKIDLLEYQISKFYFIKNLYQNNYLRIVNLFFFNSRNRSAFNKFIKHPENREEILKEIFLKHINEFDSDSFKISHFKDNFTIANPSTLLNPQTSQPLGNPIQQQQFFEIYKSNETQSIIDNIFKEFENSRITKIKSFLNENNNQFTISFINGNIENCNLILKYYKSSIKRITKKTIVETIRKKNIHILKYYYNNHKDLFEPSPYGLIDDLKNELLNNSDYQYDIDWLK